MSNQVARNSRSHYLFQKANKYEIAATASRDQTIFTVQYTLAAGSSNRLSDELTLSGGALTVKKDGLYIISGQVVWATSAVGERLVSVNCAGGDVCQRLVVGAGSTTQAMSTPFSVCVFLVKDQVISVQARQQSGGNLDLLGKDTSAGNYTRMNIIYLG